KHAPVKRTQRGEEVQDPHNDETEEKGPDAHDVRRRRYARRGQQRKQEEGDQSEVDGRQGERQGSDRLEAEEGVLVVRPELERSGTESANASRDAVIGPYDGRQGEGEQGKGDDLENGREECKWREGRVQIEHDGLGAKQNGSEGTCEEARPGTWEPPSD